MNKAKEQDELLSCDVCMTEIPPSVGKSYEGPDYVIHFCGTDCFEKWQKQKKDDASSLQET